MLHLLVLVAIFGVFIDGAKVLNMSTGGVMTSSSAGIRAAWISYNAHCLTKSQCADTMTYLHASGINRVYVDVWNQGRTFFPSQRALDFCGSGCVADPQFEWALTAGKPLGLQVFAWFEYGLMAAYSDINNDFARAADAVGWIIGTAHSFVWMDPTSGATDYIADIMAELLSLYPTADGVQLDDHFALPSAIVGTGHTAVMEDAVEKVWRRVRAVSSASLSLSPNPISTSINSYNVDWVRLLNLGYFNEVVPQLYRSSFSTFLSVLNETLEAVSTAIQHILIIGLRCNGAGAPTPWMELEQMILYTERNGLGASVWYSMCLLETYPDQMRAMWGR